MRLPSLQNLIRKYFRLPRKKLWIAALKLQRWPVNWWDEKLEEKRITVKKGFKPLFSKDVNDPSERGHD